MPQYYIMKALTMYQLTISQYILFLLVNDSF